MRYAVRMEDHDYSHMTDARQLNAPEGLAPRLSQEEVAKPAPSNVSLKGAEHSRMAREIGGKSQIVGNPNDHTHNRYHLIERASRIIRGDSESRER